MPVWFIGLMSGTSLDGIDGVLAQATDGGPGLRAHTHVHLPLPAALRAQLLLLNTPGDNELHHAALAANALMACYGDVVAALLARSGVGRGQVVAIGAHGQTVRHRPGEFDGTGYTVQLVNGALLAERTGIDVVCDFRSRDVAAGGQGAPLAPGFHAACFGGTGVDRAVLNLGGIANLTLLRADGSVLGFDCGPGNVLMDMWCQRHRGTVFDAGGAWAAGGSINAALLARLLSDPYFGRAPPKSTGRDLFDAEWLARQLDGFNAAAQDVMATLAELTARGVADALRRHAPDTAQLLVCGGGTLNANLMRRVAALLGSSVTVASTAQAGVPPDQVEALAFAWLASAFCEGRAGNLPAVTGACGMRVLGALHRAG